MFGLNISFSITTASTRVLYLRILRGSTEIIRYSINSIAPGDGEQVFRLLQALPPIVDQPAAGTHTYTLQYALDALARPPTFLNITASTVEIKSQHISIALSEVKK